MGRMTKAKQMGALATAVALLVAGCTSSGDDGSEEGEQPAASEDAADSDGSAVDGDNVRLDVWVLSEPEGSEAFLPAMIEAFESENPGIEVRTTEIPEDTYFTRMDTALIAGSPPDIGLIFEPRWVQANKVLPLTDVIAEYDIDISQFSQAAIGGCRRPGDEEGEIYCLGSNLGTVMLLYNKAMFDEAGLDHPPADTPLTIDEYGELAAALSVPSDDLNERVWGGVGEAPVWWMDRATHFSSDGRTTEGYVNDAATVNAYDVLTGLIRDGHAPSGAAYELFSNTDLLATNRLAMTISDSFADIPTLDAQGIEWGAAPVPVEQEGDLAFVPAWTDPFGVFADSDNVEAAMKFVAFSATEGQRMRVEVGDDLPLDLSKADDWAGDNPGRAELVTVARLARDTVFVPNYWEVVSPIWDLFYLMSQGDIEVQEALDEAAVEMQENLDREWRTWEEID